MELGSRAVAGEGAVRLVGAEGPGLADGGGV